MNTIWKYPLKSSVEIEMPKGAHVLTAQMQAGEPCLWVIVDPKKTEGTTIRKFKVLGTGQDFKWDDDLDYIATFQDGAYVWHVFEVE